jgi:hypothetical protein
VEAASGAEKTATTVRATAGEIVAVVRRKSGSNSSSNSTRSSSSSSSSRRRERRGERWRHRRRNAPRRGHPKGTQTPAPPLTARRAAKATGSWRQTTPPQKLCWFLAYGSSQRGEEGDGGIGGDRTPAGPPKGTQTLAPPLTARRAAKATGGAGPEPAVRRRSLQVARRSRNQLSRSSSVSDGVAASLRSTPTTEPLRLHEAPTVDLLAYPKCI